MTKAELERVVREQARQIEALRARRLPKSREVLFRPSQVGNRIDLSAILVLSDWHVEERTEVRGVEGVVSRHGLRESENKIRSILKGALCAMAVRQTGRRRLRHLTVGLLGDFLTGHIHEEMVETCELPPGEAIVWLHDRLVPMIETLARESGVETMRLVFRSGNHGRTTDRPRTVSRGHSWEDVLYAHLVRATREVKTRKGRKLDYVLDPGAEILYTREPGFGVVRWIHGHEGRMGASDAAIRRRLGSWDQVERASLTVMGHFHNPTFRICESPYLINGSLIGTNAWANTLGFVTPGGPSQMLAFYSVTQDRLFGIEHLPACAVGGKL